MNKPYIASLASHGLKSGDFEHSLAPVTIFCGSSFSGKTSRLDALRLGLGADLRDELRGTLLKPMALARNGHVSVEIVDSLGRKNEREWRAKSKHNKHDDIPALPAVLLDSALYFELSEAKKIEYVFSLAKIGEHPNFNPPAIIAALKNVRLEQNTEETESVLTEIITAIPDLGAGPRQQWLERRIGELKERLSVAIATAKRMAATVAGITQLGAAELPARNFTAEIAAKRKELAAVQETIGGINQSLREYAALQEKHERLAAKLERLPVVEVTDPAGDISSLEEGIRMIEAANRDQDYADKIAALSTRIEVIQAEIEAYKSGASDLHNEHFKLFTELSGLKRECESFERSMAREKEAFALRLCLPCCPECGTPTDNIKERIQASHDTLLAALNEEITSRQSSAEKIQAQLTELEVRHTIALEGDKIIVGKQDDWKRMLTELKGLMDERQSAERQRVREIDQARKQIQGLRDAAVQARQQNAQRDLLARQLKESEAEMTAFPIVAKQMGSSVAQSDRILLMEQITALDKAQSDYQRQQDDERRNAQARVENLKAQADVAVTKACIDVLEKVRAEMVETAFAGILATVNRITSGIIREPVEYHDGELGRFVKSTWISHATFSGTEKALTYAGISLALAGDSPLKLVMMDELGKMDGSTLHAFLSRMVELTKAGEIGQFLGAFAGELDETTLPGVKVVRV